MKKLWIATMVLLLLAVLSGCGGDMTLEDKIAEVQKQTEISTEDVLALMTMENSRSNWLLRDLCFAVEQTASGVRMQGVSGGIHPLLGE